MECRKKLAEEEEPEQKKFLNQNIAELQRAMLKTSSSVTVKEWLKEYASPVRIQLENLLQKIDVLWICDLKQN